MKSSITIAAAQFAPFSGDVEKNSRVHESLARDAASKGADIVLFPEMSLTGYEPGLAASLVFHTQDSRLEFLRDLAEESGLVILAGAPVRNVSGKPAIGLFICNPDRTIEQYLKNHLHPGEDACFSAGTELQLMDVNGWRIGLSVCADSCEYQHARRNAEAGAEIYLCSVLVSAGGYPEDTARMQSYCKALGMNVIMANYSGPSGGWEPVGRSCGWNTEGEMIAQGSEQGTEVVLFRFEA